MEAYKKKLLITFSIVLVLLSGGLGIYFQISTTRIWYDTTEEMYLDVGRDDGVKVSLHNDIAFISYELYGFKVYNFSDSNNPELINQVNVPNTYVTDHFLVNHTYYLLNYKNLSIYDVTDPINIVEIGHYDRESMICGIYVNEGIAYLNTRESFLILNVSDPSHIQKLSETPILLIDQNERGIAYQDGIVFLASYGQGVVIYDVEDPTSPQLVSQVDDYGYISIIDEARTVSVSNDLMFVSDGIHGMVIFNISDLTNIYRISVFSNSIPRSVLMEDSTLYIADYFAGLKTLDISNLPSVIEQCDFVDRRGMRSILPFGDDVLILGKGGLSIVNTARGEGRNPAQVSYIRQIIPGVYEIAGISMLVIYLLTKLKKANI
ncbi:hypothetical protein NEF87_002575 [Candidatus Lokiarchaeum ossiferum]|uniref:LVIVD repeat protein n=1 Tax=Candidatus Lokiarchaeum ossiferum TaxID=2951803 RepID=A0ABY6HRZ9_9ARCH|nr:hypothetical protein NEF87_002575 [Candidatus Lokiarchaeum sp. B-35]